MAFHVTRRNEFLAQNADEAALADLPTKYGVTLLPRRSPPVRSSGA